LVTQIQPDEIYNLGAQSHVAVSFKNPLYTTQTSTIGPLALLETIKNSDKKIKYYQASSSEMFGGKEKVSLNEESPLIPKSPYASSKVFAHEINKIYRESYDIFGVNGILFNHESPRRGETFVTRKITKAIGRIHHGLQTKLTLGNLKASRDWGFAGDYVKAMWMMMQHETPDDWVVATGKTYTVEDFLVEAFKILDLNWEDYVITSENYYRPNEVDYLLGDPTKIKKQLDWKPEVDFQELVKMMVEIDLNVAEKELTLVKNNLLKPTWEHPAV
jgi:GDPmannose 4,6-dehydratase